jgi:hypothetical protein
MRVLSVGGPTPATPGPTPDPTAAPTGRSEARGGGHSGVDRVTVARDDELGLRLGSRCGLPEWHDGGVGKDAQPQHCPVPGRDGEAPLWTLYRGPFPADFSFSSPSTASAPASRSSSTSPS